MSRRKRPEVTADLYSAVMSQGGRDSFEDSLRQVLDDSDDVDMNLARRKQKRTEIVQQMQREAEEYENELKQQEAERRHFFQNEYINTLCDGCLKAIAENSKDNFKISQRVRQCCSEAPDVSVRSWPEWVELAQHERNRRQADQQAQAQAQDRGGGLFGGLLGGGR